VGAAASSSPTTAPTSRSPTTVHVPVPPVSRSPTPSANVSVSSSVVRGGRTWTEKLSKDPRELSEPTPTRPYSSPYQAPSTCRGAYRYVARATPSTSTVTTRPFTTTSRP